MVAHLVWDQRAAGSNPVIPIEYGSLAQLGERLPYKQDVTGSSPVTPISTDLKKFLKTVDKTRNMWYNK